MRSKHFPWSRLRCRSRTGYPRGSDCLSVGDGLSPEANAGHRQVTIPQNGVIGKFEFPPVHASGAEGTLVSFGLRSNRRRHNVALSGGILLHDAAHNTVPGGGIDCDQHIRHCTTAGGFAPGSEDVDLSGAAWGLRSKEKGCPGGQPSLLLVGVGLLGGFGGGEALVDLVPVDGVPPGGEVVGALVLVFEVVGVLPDVVAEDGVVTLRERVVLVGGGDDLQLAALEDEPAPAGAELLGGDL